MSNMFDAAVTMVNDSRVASMSTTVAYRRGELTLTPTATPSKRPATTAELLAGYGQSFNRMDFIISAADLGALGASAVGDEITFGGVKYGVMEIDGRAFAKCDPDGVMIRVFAAEA